MDASDSALRLNAAQLLLTGAPPSRTALVDGTRSLSWGELQLATARAAWAWQDCGVQPGETVLVRLAPGMARAVALLGAIWAGAVPLPLSREVAAREWQAWAAAQGCRFMLDEQRDGHPTAWRDQVLSRAEWQAALDESRPVAAVAAPAGAAACWTDFRPGGRLRLLAHGFALARGTAPGGGRSAHTPTTLGMLRALRRGATAVLPQPVLPQPARRALLPGLAGAWA